VILEAAPVVSSGPDLWARIDAIRGDEQLSYSSQPIIEELAFD
jgi:hypothetical protein